MKKCFSIKALLSAGLALTFCVFTTSSVSGQILVNDSFDDGNLTTNTLGVGSGFNEQAQSNGSSNAETGGSAVLDGISNGGTRLRINSIEGADTTTAAGANYLFEDLVIGLASNDGGDGATFRNAVGVAQGNATHAVDNLADGFFVAIANDFYTAGGTGFNDNSFFFHQAGGVRTQLASWDFDTLAFTDGDPAGTDGTVTANPLNVAINLDSLNWSLDITGDTQGGGSAVSFAGTHAGSGIVNVITAGSAYVGTQTESPNVSLSVGRIQIENNVSSVPEPTSLALLGLGSIGILVRRKRR